MTNESFWKLEHRTNEQLLAGLESIIRSCRQRTAELIAHLAEVEARRLHLEMACGSMFDYCVKRLGLSEDEACRRIDVARLARRFPVLFPRLASGEISLSVAASLKPYLAENNQAQVLANVTGKTVQQAREAIAALFPQPDIAPSVRKLPERRPVATANAPDPKPISAPPLALSAPARKLPTPIQPLAEARYHVQLTGARP